MREGFGCRSLEVIIPHHLLAIQLETDPKNSLKLFWDGLSETVRAPKQLPMTFSVFTANQKKTLPSC